MHTRPGGVAGFVPDNTKESFEEASDVGGTDAADGRGVRYLDWAWDPDSGDDWALTEYAFLLRDAGGLVRSLHETHRLGLFSRETWLRCIAEAGFEAATFPEETSEDRTPRDVFVGHRL